MYIKLYIKTERGMKAVNEDEKDFKVDLNGFDDSEINLDDFAEIIHDLDEENEQENEQDKEREDTSEKSHAERSAEERSQERKPEQEEELKDKQDEKKNDVPFREKFMEGVKKAPVYAAGVILAVIGLIRQAIRAILFGPSYARRTEEEFGKKIDELRNSEELEKENHDREKERDEQEKKKEEHDKDKDRENHKDEREQDDKNEENKDEENKDEETVETEQQPDSEDLLEEKETSTGEEQEEQEENEPEKNEEEEKETTKEDAEEKKAEEERTNDENKTKENLDDEKKKTEGKAETGRGKNEPKFVFDEKSQENTPEAESDKKAIYEKVFGTENPFAYANDERKQKPEHFSTEAMTSKDICGLLQTKDAREAMKAIEDSFGVQLRFSKDMTQINLVDTNAELENRQIECENESHTEKSTFHFTTYPESAISRPIDTMLFLKGDITQMAAACKDIGCELHGANESETSGDSRNIMAAAMITAKFRQDTLHEYQADGIHKINRNSSVLAYLPKTFSINGEKIDKTQQYDIHSVKIGKEENGGNTIEVLSDERKNILDCKSADLMCKLFTEHDNGTMTLIENLSDFPPENKLSDTQLFQAGKVMDALRDGQYLKDYMSVYGGTQEDIKPVMNELEAEVLDIIRSIPFGLTNSQMESCERINDMYSHTASLANQSREDLSKTLNQMDSEMEENSKDELDAEQAAETDDVLDEEQKETETGLETDEQNKEQPDLDEEASL